jgi:DNA-binding HxlR family transcriptional regulator
METSRRDLILRSLQDGRKQWCELERELVKSGKMGSATLSSHLKDLEREGTVRKTLDSSHRPPLSWYSLKVSSADREQILKILKQIQSSTISSHKRLPDGTEIWSAESAPAGTKLEATSEELSENLGKPWHMIEETAYALGKELGLKIGVVAYDKVRFYKEHRLSDPVRRFQLMFNEDT